MDGRTELALAAGEQCLTRRIGTLGAKVWLALLGSVSLVVAISPTAFAVAGDWGQAWEVGSRATAGGDLPPRVPLASRSEVGSGGLSSGRLYFFVKLSLFVGLGVVALMLLERLSSTQGNEGAAEAPRRRMMKRPRRKLDDGRSPAAPPLAQSHFGAASGWPGVAPMPFAMPMPMPYPVMAPYSMVMPPMTTYPSAAPAALASPQQHQDPSAVASPQGETRGRERRRAAPGSVVERRRRSGDRGRAVKPSRRSVAKGPSRGSAVRADAVRALEPSDLATSAASRSGSHSERSAASKGDVTPSPPEVCVSDPVAAGGQVGNFPIRSAAAGRSVGGGSQRLGAIPFPVAGAQHARNKSGPNLAGVFQRIIDENVAVVESMRCGLSL
jgi:hypothetical protein